jgi:hypothetical protein
MNLCEKQSTTCSYTEFRSRIKNWVVSDFTDGCKKKIIEDEPVDNKRFKFIGATIDGVEKAVGSDFVIDLIIIQFGIIVLLLIAVII